MSKLFLDLGFRFLRRGGGLIFFPVYQNELIPRFAKTLQTFLHEENRGKNIPAIDYKQTTVVVMVFHILKRVAVALFEIANARINPPEYLAVRFVFTNRKILLILN